MDDQREFPAERLELFFTCCHPALEPDERVALSLRVLGRLTSAEIARAFGVPTTTIAVRLLRAKAKIKAASIVLGASGQASLQERLAVVLATIHAIFNRSYGGDGDLAAVALQLGGMLAELMPGEPETHGLLAVMLLNHGRRSARFRHGELITFENEERVLSDRGQIADGEAHLARAHSLRGRGAYLLQATIASVHMAEPVDWLELTALYSELLRVMPSGVVELNRAVAVAEVLGPEAALRILERIEFEYEELDDFRHFHAMRAEFLSRLERTVDARFAYGRALQLTKAESERRFLKRRIAELPPPAAADWEAFWDSTLNRLKAAAEADEIEDR